MKLLYASEPSFQNCLISTLTLRRSAAVLVPLLASMSTYSISCASKFKLPAAGEQRLSLEDLHIVFLFCVSGPHTNKYQQALRLSLVSRKWRQAAHSLPAMWKPFILDATPMAVATSTHQFDQTIHLLHPIFSSLDADVTLPRNTARSPQAQLVVDRLQF